MKNFWNDEDIKDLKTEVGYLKYFRRLVSKEKNLGLISSVKGSKRDDFGEARETLSLDIHGTVVDIDSKYLEKVLNCSDVNDEFVFEKLKAQNEILSLDLLLHSAISKKYVSNVYSNLLLSIENTQDAEKRLKEIYGESVLVIPFTASKVELAKRVSDALKHIDSSSLEAIVILNHSVITFSDNPKAIYDNYISISQKALAYLTKNGATICGEDEVEGNLSFVEGLASFFEAFVKKPKKCLFGTDVNFAKEPKLFDILNVRRKASSLNNRAVLAKFVGGDKSAYFSNLKNLDEIIEKGSVVPTLINKIGVVEDKIVLKEKCDWAVYKGFGNIAFAGTRGSLDCVSSVIDSSISTIIRSETLGGYTPLNVEDATSDNIEYKSYSGKVVVITNVVNSVGLSIISKLLENDAVVFALDSREEVTTLFDNPNYNGKVCDLLDEYKTASVIREIVKTYNAFDILISNIGGKEKGVGVTNWQKMLDQNFTMHKNVVEASKKFLEYGHNPIITTLATKEVIRGLIDGEIIQRIEEEQQLIIKKTKESISSPKIRVTSVITAARYNSSKEEMDNLQMDKLISKSDEVAEIISTICSDMFKNSKNTNIKVD